MKHFLRWKTKASFLVASLLFAVFVTAPNVLAAGSWQTVGTADFSAAAVDYTSLAFDGNTPYVAYVDDNNGSNATVMKFDGASWVNVGGVLSANGAGSTSLAFDGSGTPYVAYQDSDNGNGATVMRFVGDPAPPNNGSQGAAGTTTPTKDPAPPDTGYGAPAKPDPVITMIIIGSTISAGTGLTLFYRQKSRTN